MTGAIEGEGWAGRVQSLIGTVTIDTASLGVLLYSVLHFVLLLASWLSTSDYRATLKDDFI